MPSYATRFLFLLWYSCTLAEVLVWFVVGSPMRTYLCHCYGPLQRSAFLASVCAGSHTGMGQQSRCVLASIL
jgi:hypothetical protein